MATFVPISYTYVPTAPRIKSTTARLKPASQQSSILHTNLSEAEASTPQPIAANDIGVERLGIRETSLVNGGDDDNGNNDDDGLPSIEQLLFTTLQKEGFTVEDQRPENTAFGVGDTSAEERRDSVHDNGSALVDNSGGSPGDPILLLDDDDSSASEAEADTDGDDVRTESAAADEGLLGSPETDIDSTTPATPSNPDVWHDIDDFPAETVQHRQRSEQDPLTLDYVRPHAPSSRTSGEPLHDHVNAAGQRMDLIRSEATISHSGRSQNQPPDHVLTNRSAEDEHNEPIRPALTTDTFDRKERQRQEEEQEQDDDGNDRQPQQEVAEEVAATQITGTVGDTYLSSKKVKSQGLANYDSFPQSQDKLGKHSGRYSYLELESNPESDDDDGGPRPAKQKRPTPSNSLMHEKRKHHPEQRSARQCALHSKSYWDKEGPQEQRGEKRRHQDATEDASSGICQSEGDEHSTGGEEDEEPRAAKRRKRSAVSSGLALTPPLEHSATSHLRRPHRPRRAPSSTAQHKRDKPPPQADHQHLSTTVDDEHYCTPPTSRSPSFRTTPESAPFAEYREWPLQGFLKRVTIGDQTTYNLEFSLPYIPEQLNLSLHSRGSSTRSKESGETAVSRQAVTFRKLGKELTKNQEILLAKLVREDKTWKEIGERFPGHTLQSLKENFFTEQGGKPRKRGRKPGIRSKR